MHNLNFTANEPNIPDKKQINRLLTEFIAPAAGFLPNAVNCPAGNDLKTL